MPSRPDRATHRLAKRVISATYSRIYDVVARIPRGHVMTYGQVAQAAGIPGAARVVGYAMRASLRKVPWQRVVGQKRPGVAHVTIRDPVGAAVQRQLLEKEGVAFRDDDTIDLAHHGVAAGRATPRPRRKRKRPAR